ncbi:MAG: RpiB/LacA/LacB family sugar-phosphate isomerase, partial [Myxococcales bacterium]|nr:RpiB/LacA/LacB family sugar-phosphate isomerase [Myxococcales bacterium]
LAMGARIVGVAIAIGCVEAFLAGEFQGGRHERRVEKIGLLEREESGSSSDIP